MRIIPAIDLIDGKCVRLTKGDYSQKTVYNEDPIEVAKEFEDHGVRYLHLVDLDGAKEGRVMNYPILDRIASSTRLKVDFGGGVRSGEDVSKIFDHGGEQAVIGSLAFKDRDLFFEIFKEFGAHRIVLGADARDRKIAVGGWMESTELLLDEMVRRYREEGVFYFLCTDIEKDGMMQGPAAALYEDLLEANPDIALIASGGIRDWEDVEHMRDIGCEAVIIGKAIYERKITLKELEKNLV